MTTAQVVETSLAVNNNPIQDYVPPDDHTQPSYEMTPGFKPFKVVLMFGVFGPRFWPRENRSEN